MIIKPNPDFRDGTPLNKFETEVLDALGSGKITIDLTDVVFMDSSTFSSVFRFQELVANVIPPKDQYVIEIYNLWLDSKKGFSK